MRRKSDWANASSLLLHQFGDCGSAADSENLLKSARLVCKSWRDVATSAKRHWKAKHGCTAAQLVAAFPNLTDIDLTSAQRYNLGGLGPILSLSELQRLVLGNILVTDPSEASRALERARGLQSLSIVFHGPAPTFSFAQLTKLTSLDLMIFCEPTRNADTAESVLAQAASLRQLQQLALTDLTISTVACASLCQLSQLRQVSLVHLAHIDDPGDSTVSAVLEALCKLEGLRELSNAGVLMSSRQDAHYQMQPSLCHVPISSMSRLTCLTRLEFIGYSCEPVALAMLCCLESFDDAQALADLTVLTALELKECVYGESMFWNFVPFVTALTGLSVLQHLHDDVGPPLQDDDALTLTALTNLRLLQVAADISQSAQHRLRHCLPLLDELLVHRGDIESASQPDASDTVSTSDDEDSDLEHDSQDMSAELASDKGLTVVEGSDLEDEDSQDVHVSSDLTGDEDL